MAKRRRAWFSVYRRGPDAVSWGRLGLQLNVRPGRKRRRR